MNIKQLTTPVAALALSAGAANAAIVTVGPSLVDYDYITITAAISGSNSGDEILIQPGLYPENLDIISKDLILRNAGGGAVTVFGQGLDKCLKTTGSTTDVEVYGITFTGGFSASAGGGVSIEGGSRANLTDCIIENSESTSVGGGGLYMSGGGTITNTIIRNNTSAGDGGGVHLRGSLAKSFVGCTIEGNTGVEGGGVAYATAGDLNDFIDCVFIGNTATNRGGAIAVLGSTSAGIVDVENCVFEMNRAESVGGAIWISDQDAFYAQSSLFIGNTAFNNGGVVRNEQLFEAVFCTFVDNGVDTEGISDSFESNRSDADTNLLNCIVLNDSAASHNGSGSLNATYTLLPEGPGGAADGNGNFNANPMFVDPMGTDGDASNDFMLMPGSPAIDAGNSRGAFASVSVLDITVDLNGDIRNLDDPNTSNTGVSTWELCVDLGAYEFQPAPAGPDCAADFVEDGVLDVFDVFEFLNQFNAGCP